MTKKIGTQHTETCDNARDVAIFTRLGDMSDSDTPESDDLDALWLSTTIKEKDRSRVQRQMKARRELERHLDEKRLKELVDDWYFDDKP